MSTTLLRGEAGYHSKVMDRDRALAFARMIDHHPAFKSAMVERATHCQPPKCWRVAYEPVSLEAYVRLLQTEQRKRDDRAEQQWAGYRIYRTRLPGCFDVWNLRNHEQYQTHILDQEDSCNCMDAFCRLQGCSLLRLTCKHYAICLLHLEMDLVQGPQVYGRLAEAERELVAA